MHKCGVGGVVTCLWWWLHSFLAFSFYEPSPSGFPLKTCQFLHTMIIFTTPLNEQEGVFHMRDLVIPLKDRQQEVWPLLAAWQYNGDNYIPLGI